MQRHRFMSLAILMMYSSAFFVGGGGQNFRYKKTRKGLHYILQQASVLISHTMHLFVNRVAIENYCLIAIKRDCYPVNISENVLDTAASRWESVSSDSSPSNWTVRLKVLYFIRNFIISKSSREAWWKLLKSFHNS